MSTIYVRFDIDTIVCIEQGVPRLLDLAEKLGVRFTFFANFGRSIDRREMLFRDRRRVLLNTMGGSTKLSVIRKLGWLGLSRTLLLNPLICGSHLSLIRQAMEAGHEVGLHGGMNHGTWQRLGHDAPEAQFSTWLEEVMPLYTQVASTPGGFASPGGAGNRELYRVLRKRQFSYVSDVMNDKATGYWYEDSGLPHVPITGHVNLVPLIENARANGRSETDILQSLRSWPQRVTFCSYYAHPLWEGFRDIALQRRIFNAWLEDGHTIVPYREALKNGSSISRQ